MSWSQEKNNEFLAGIGGGLVTLIIILYIFWSDHKDNEMKPATVQACLNRGNPTAECAKLGR